MLGRDFIELYRNCSGIWHLAFRWSTDNKTLDVNVLPGWLIRSMERLADHGTSTGQILQGSGHSVTLIIARTKTVRTKRKCCSQTNALPLPVILIHSRLMIPMATGHGLPWSFCTPKSSPKDRRSQRCTAGSRACGTGKENKLCWHADHVAVRMLPGELVRLHRPGRLKNGVYEPFRAACDARTDFLRVCVIYRRTFRCAPHEARACVGHTERLVWNLALSSRPLTGAIHRLLNRCTCFCFPHGQWGSGWKPWRGPCSGNWPPAGSYGSLRLRRIISPWLTATLRPRSMENEIEMYCK